MSESNEKGRCETCRWSARDTTSTTCRFNPPGNDGFPWVSGGQWCRQYNRDTVAGAGRSPPVDFEDQQKLNALKNEPGGPY